MTIASHLFHWSVSLGKPYIGCPLWSIGTSKCCTANHGMITDLYKGKYKSRKKVTSTKSQLPHFYWAKHHIPVMHDKQCHLLTVSWVEKQNEKRKLGSSVMTCSHLELVVSTDWSGVTQWHPNDRGGLAIGRYRRIPDGQNTQCSKRLLPYGQCPPNSLLVLSVSTFHSTDVEVRVSVLSVEKHSQLWLFCFCRGVQST